MVQSRTKSGSINDLRAKPFQPSRYPQARIEEPTISQPIEEFLSLEEKKEHGAIKQRRESWTSYGNRD